MQTIVHLLGRVAISDGRKPGGAVKLERQEQAVLGRLLLDANRALDRTRLIELLWPERAPDSGCRCLNTALWRLRRALADVEGLSIETGRGLGIRMRTADTVVVDFWRFHQLADPIVRSSTYRSQARLSDHHLAQLEAATTLYEGPFLPGLDLDWVEDERQMLEEEYLQCLSLLGRHYDDLGEDGRALELYRKILRLDPTREDIHRCAMASYEKLGLRGMALRQYATCISELRNTLAVDVAKETALLAATISSGSDPRAAGLDTVSASPASNLEAARSQLTLLHAQMRDATSIVAGLLEKLAGSDLRSTPMAASIRNEVEVRETTIVEMLAPAIATRPDL